MSTFLRLGEAARQLGVSVDTLRRYIDDGRLPSFRTPGGQTQVRAEDVAALRSLGAVAPRKQSVDQLADNPDLEETAVNPDTGHRQRPRRPAWMDLPPWERQKAQFKAELEIEQIRRERKELDEATNRRAGEERATVEESERLSKLKRSGKLWCWDLSLEPLVVRKLEQFVTTERVPPWLSRFEQQNIVSQFVLGLVKRLDERKNAEESNRIQKGFRDRRDD